MITQKTCEAIWHTYREVEAGHKLLDDLKKERERTRVAPNQPCLKDAFGRVQQIQLGLPSGENSHRLYDVSPELAESMIRAHIANKKAALANLQETARAELDQSA